MGEDTGSNAVQYEVNRQVHRKRGALITVTDALVGGGQASFSGARDSSRLFR